VAPSWQARPLRSLKQRAHSLRALGLSHAAALLTASCLQFIATAGQGLDLPPQRGGRWFADDGSAGCAVFAKRFLLLQARQGFPQRSRLTRDQEARRLVINLRWCVGWGLTCDPRFPVATRNSVLVSRAPCSEEGTAWRAFRDVAATEAKEDNCRKVVNFFEATGAITPPRRQVPKGCAV